MTPLLRFLAPAAALPLLLTACGSADAPASNLADPPATGNTAASIASLAEGQRNGVLLRAIRDAGRDCQGVTRSEPGAREGANPSAWVATCSDGAPWLVTFGADGIATVTDARAAAAAS